MRQKACCCSAHLCLLLMRMYRGLATFDQNDTKVRAFSTNTAACSTALTTHIVAMSRTLHGGAKVDGQSYLLLRRLLAYPSSNWGRHSGFFSIRM